MKFLLVFLLTIGMPLLFYAQTADDIIGNYNHYDRKYDLIITIEIYKHTENNYGCKIVRTTNGKHATVALPYSAYQSRPLIGTNLATTAITFEKSQNEWHGVIYHPVWKRSISCVITLHGKNHVRIYGYFGPRWLRFGDSLGWNRI